MLRQVLGHLDCSLELGGMVTDTLNRGPFRAPATTAALCGPGSWALDNILPLPVSSYVPGNKNPNEKPVLTAHTPPPPTPPGQHHLALLASQTRLRPPVAASKGCSLEASREDPTQKIRARLNHSPGSRDQLVLVAGEAWRDTTNFSLLTRVRSSGVRIAVLGRALLCSRAKPRDPSAVCGKGPASHLARSPPLHPWSRVPSPAHPSFLLFPGCK